MSKIKILHIITRLCVGGAQENTYLTLRGLLKKGYEVSLICGKVEKLEGSLKDKFIKLIPDLYYIPELVRSPHPLKDIISFLKIYYCIKKGGFQIVHTHTSKAGIIGRMAAKLAKVPIIIHTPHGHIFHDYYGFFKTKFFLYLEKFTALFTDKIITLTEVEKEEHLNLRIAPPEKFVTIFSGVEMEPFLKINVDRNMKRKEFNLSEDVKVVGTVARLVPIKGHKYLLQAIPKIVKEVSGVKFLLVGDGPLRAELESLADELGIADYVIFCGLRDDVPEILSILNLFVLPSLNEGMGKAIIEAEAAQLPVIATSVGGIKEIVVDGVTGLLVPPKDSDGLASAIIRLLKEEELAKEMGRKGKEKFIPYYCAEGMVEKIENLYKELMENKL